jgi:NAD(P)-dependent dehydrogenase (short-subunit alcohol dehydrogenase family)
MASNSQQRPLQHQEQQPGVEHNMTPQPIYIRDDYRGSGKLIGKVALISGGDSGIGRAVAIHFAKEGADVAFIYKEEDSDAEETEKLIKACGQRSLKLRGDVGDEAFCQRCVQDTIAEFDTLNILVNNAAEQHPQTAFEDVTSEQMRQTFTTNFFAYFYLTQAALPHLRESAAIINTTSVTAYRGATSLVDYASTKGAIVAYTRSLSLALVEKGIRVNGVAPGPIWTPLIPATFPADRVATFGKSTPMKRAGQPAEVAPSYVLLASADGSYMTGQIIHTNGGDFITT